MTRSRARRPRAILLVLLAGLLLAGPLAAGERWGWLGVRIRDLSETEMEELSVKHGLREGYGVVIADVLKETPAAAAGLQTGDLVVAIGVRPVVETRALQRIVGGAPPGRELRLTVLREGRRQEVRVRVGQMPPDVVAERVAAEFGFLVREASPDDVRTGLDGGYPVVAAVAEESAAARGGLRTGDRILDVESHPVASVEELRARMSEVLLRRELRLRVRRQGEPLTLVLPAAQVTLPAH